MAFAMIARDPAFARFSKLIGDMHAELGALNGVFSRAIDHRNDDTPTMFLNRMLESNEPLAANAGIFSADFVEYAKHYVVKVDVPGMSSADLRVSIENGRDLLISGERKAPTAAHGPSVDSTPSTTSESNLCFRERFHGKFARTISLPADIDTSNVDASAHNGVLTVVIAKKAAALDSRKSFTVRTDSPPSDTETFTDLTPSGTETYTDSPASGTEASTDVTPSGTEPFTDSPASGTETYTDVTPSGTEPFTDSPASGTEASSTDMSSTEITPQTDSPSTGSTSEPFTDSAQVETVTPLADGTTEAFTESATSTAETSSPTGDEEDDLENNENEPAFANVNDENDDEESSTVTESP